jgi:putative ABC transport system permease protein
VLVDGDWLDGSRDDEVIVSAGFAKARGISPGDHIALIIDGQRKQLRVVGIGISAEFVYLVPPGAIAPTPADFGVFYVPRRFAEQRLDMTGAVNSLVGLLTPAGRGQPEAVLDRLRARSHPTACSRPRRWRSRRRT